MAMMLHLLESFENTRRSLDDRVTEVADRTGDLAEQTSAFSYPNETCDAAETCDATKACDAAETCDATETCDETGQSVNGQKRADFTFTSANVSGSVCGRQFACAHCQRSYVTKDGLKVHVDRMHKKLYRYRCESCGKGFVGRSVYHDHIAAHTGVKRHTCRLTPYIFTILWSFCLP